jgi:hypothetical protein
MSNVIDLSSVAFTNDSDIVPLLFTAQITNTGIIDTLSGNDVIFGTGDSFNFSGFGIYNNGTINMGSGSDMIVGTGFVGLYNDYNGIINSGTSNDSISGVSTSGNGVYNAGIVSTGLGNDSISGFSIGTAGGIVNVGVANAGIIDTGFGNDTISGTGSYGIVSTAGSSIKMGDGDDRLVASTKLVGGYAVWNDGFIDTGSGNDILDAHLGGFFGIVLLGQGRDFLKGFGSGVFDGGSGGRDTLLLPSGTYTLSDSANSEGFYIVSNGTTDMLVKDFEFIGKIGNTTADYGSFLHLAGETFLI